LTSDQYVTKLYSHQLSNKWFICKHE